MTQYINNISPIIILLIILLISSTAIALENYQSPEDFISSNFSDQTPDSQRLKLDDDLKKQIKRILGHKIRRSRIRYWQQGDRTVWILNEIGKTQPITTGLVVNAGKIEQLKVLKFRESRGSEIKYPFFTDQFKGVGLDKRNDLNKSIDGISGATLSVRAMKKLARVAIVLHNHVIEIAK